MHRPIKLLHTEWSRGWGGQEIRILDESEAFLGRGYQVTLACKSGSPIERAARERAIPTVNFPFLASADFKTIFLIAGYLRREKVDVVQTHSSIDSWTASMAARLVRVPVVRSRHLSTPVSTSWSSRFLYMTLADRVITSGQVIKDAMVGVNGFDPDKIISIPAGADEAKYRPGIDPGPIRREFGLSEDDYLIGIVAILRSWKGHRDLFDAVTLIGQDIPGLKVLVAGDGPGRKSLREYVRERGLEDKIIFAGFRQDVPQVLAAMRQFILPSTKNEATSQVIPQAMLMGIPVIASTAGGLTEVVDHGRTGLLVPPGDPQAIKEAVLENYFHPDRAEARAKAAREAALKNWTFQAMIDKTEEVYFRLLRR